eukprot:gene2498-5452_t
MGRLHSSRKLLCCFGVTAAKEEQGQAKEPALHCRGSPYSGKEVLTEVAWGTPVDFYPAKLCTKKTASSCLTLVRVDVGPTIACGYTQPGQYIQVKINESDKAGYYAIASPPAESRDGIIELLLKVQPGSTAEAVCNLEEGAHVLVSPVQGSGFPVDKIPDASNILLVATGSGISPIKAVIESGVLNQAKLHLFYGTKDKDSSSYPELIPEWESVGVQVSQLIPVWESAGVQVTQVFSGDTKHYVQSVLQKEIDGGGLIPKEGPGSLAVLMCGHKSMCDEIKGILTAAGVDPNNILTNM